MIRSQLVVKLYKMTTVHDYREYLQSYESIFIYSVVTEETTLHTGPYISILASAEVSLVTGLLIANYLSFVFDGN